MMNLANHTTEGGSVFLLNLLANLTKAQSLEGTLLVNGITDLTLNLLNLNCCPSLYLLYPLNTLSILIPRVPATV